MDTSFQPPVCLNISMNLDEKFGGLTSSLPRFCEALTQTGRFTGRLAAFCAEDEVPPSSLTPGMLSRFPAGRFRWITDPKLRLKLGRLIQNAALVHIHGLWREHTVVASQLCRKFAVPYVISAHGMLEPWALNNRSWKKRGYLAVIERKILSEAAGLRALTTSEISDYRNLGLRNPIEVIPNGIDLPERVSPDPFLYAFPQLANKSAILFLGRLHKKKGIDILCRAWAQVEKKHPAAHLVVAGPDEDGTLASLVTLVRDLQIADKVTFTGMLRGSLKWSALAAASVFVLPSHSEGFSVAILEALGAGLPVIISPACHFPESIAANCGWEVVPEQNQLAATLRQALAMDPAKLSEMGERGRKLVARDFTWPRVGERAAHIFENWCEGSGKRAAQVHP